ncbi:hypothetical protein H0H81_004030 [Sphagnurus paluster]|uniref:Integrase zinc-binding domain-containing protein n=1 Tax=Sphagnurus paluster TaxID=117069 RepID=A0A9P7KJ92_9AGAR|nr:hypothetical protein H0H81_004030 [Sphagnurus paluster]
MDETTPARRVYCRFGSITLNVYKSRFSQLKLELYGIFWALGAFRLYIISVRNLILEVDARYIKGMLSNPDIQPSASINRWITAILMFDFKLVHVKGTHHGLDGLSRWPPQPGDPEPTKEEDEEIFEDWVDHMYGFMHIIQPLIPPRPPSPIVEVFAGAQITSEEEDDDKEEANKAEDRPLPTHQDLVRRNPPRNRNPDTGLLAPQINRTEKIRPVEPIEKEIPYKAVPRSYKAQLEDARIIKVRKWLEDFKRPEGMEDKELATFVWFATGFFLDGTRLWRQHRDGAHQLFARLESRIAILKAVHDDLGHRGFYATRAALTDRFWWLQVRANVVWYVRTCHYCQIQQATKVLVPPTVAMLAPLFSKVYMDTMHMPASGGYHYIVQGRCSLTHWPEWRPLRTETGHTLGKFIRQELFDNGTVMESPLGQPIIFFFTLYST